MYDKKEFPILVQLAPTDDEKEAALQTQIDNNALVIKSLNADLRATAADLAAATEIIHRQDDALFEFQANLNSATERIKALGAENERLRNENAQLGMVVQLIAFSGGNLGLAEVCALALKTYRAMEALQAKGAE